MGLSLDFNGSKFGVPLAGCYARIEDIAFNKFSASLTVSVWMAKSSSARQPNGATQATQADLLHFNVQLNAGIEAVPANPIAWGYERLKEIWPDAKDD